MRGHADEEQADDGRAADAGARATLRVACTRNFGPYFIGNLLSNSGTWFQNLAQAILVYRLTESEFLLGVVGFSQFVAVFVLAPWAGAAADRFDRRLLMLRMQLFAFAVTALLSALAWTGHASAGVVIGLALLLGVTTAFSVPAMQAFVPQLVAPGDLHHAIALNSVTFNASRVIGPVLGAVVISQLGIPWAFAFNACSYLVLVAALMVVRPRAQATPAGRRPKMRETLRAAAADRRIVALLVVTAALSFTLDPVSTLAPAYAREVLGRPDTLAGWLLGTFGIGSVIAAFTLTGRIQQSWRRLAVVVGGFGLALVGYALSPALWVSLVFLVIMGAGFLGSSTAATTRLLLTVPVEHHGRFMAIWSALFLGFRPLASLIDGAIASVDVRAAALAMAVPTVAAAAWLLARPPRERRPEAGTGTG